MPDNWDLSRGMHAGERLYVVGAERPDVKDACWGLGGRWSTWKGGKSQQQGVAFYLADQDGEATPDPNAEKSPDVVRFALRGSPILDGNAWYWLRSLEGLTVADGDFRCYDETFEWVAEQPGLPELVIVQAALWLGFSEIYLCDLQLPGKTTKAGAAALAALRVVREAGEAHGTQILDATPDATETVLERA